MEPVRTCVGCRSHGSRSSLLRVTIQDNRLVIDERKVLGGRGSWVHDEVSCLAKAIGRKAFVRALRVSGSPDTQTIEKRLNGYGNKVNGSK
ncbi:YlxR family protein [Microbacterium mitrae]|uniref:YlxR family protein n=1 Tax=Microbacterium mitrae TaxID=664640 RepID=A0A5C8HNK1_9MICO|nr:YlxR family protein [Microbacterium mitrae]TXK04599.1 YlxR family protein [Microbacterium mitrae]